MGEIIAVIVIIADIWAIVQTIQAPVTAGNKILWVFIIFILPVVGLLLWWFLGPRQLRS